MEKQPDKRDQLIAEQKRLIDMFDSWVISVKSNDLHQAKRIKELSNIVRNKVQELEKEIANEKKLIITKFN